MLLLILNLGLGLSYIGLWLMSMRQGLFWRADFTAFYTAFSMVRDGHGNRLYDFALQTNYQQQILNGQSFRDGLLPYLNPPYVAAIFAPLAWISHLSAYYLWNLGQIALLLWFLRLLWNISSTWSRRERWLLLSAAAAFPPLFLTLMLGAFSLLLLVCLLQIYWMLKRGRDVHAGLWLVVSTVKPQVAVFPIIMLLASRRWRILGSVALVMTGLLFLMGSLFGWQIWGDFLGALQLTNTYYGRFGIVPTAMYNLKGTLALILGNHQGVLITRISGIAFVIAAGLSFMLWRGSALQDNPQFELRFGLAILLGLFFSPHLHPQDGAVLVVPALMFYMHLRQHSLPHTAYTAFILFCPLMFLLGEFTIGSSLGIRIPSLAMLALVIWMTRTLHIRRPVIQAA